MIIAGVYAALIVAISGLRIFEWPYRPVLGVVALTVLVLTVVGLWSLWQTRWSGALHLVPFAIALPFLILGFTRPPIADVATRWEPAITFPVETAEVSENAMDPSLGVFEAFRGAYADIRPITVSSNPSSDVKSTAESLGWELASSGEDFAQFTVTSRVMGFVDDIKIVWDRRGDSFVIDARSRSRVGVSDLGANANRLRAFLNQLSSRTST